MKVRDDFGALVEAFRRELLVHCYRMVGSLHDAEDLVQETLLRAWRGRHTFAGRAPLRAWLYKIATNASLDLLRRRPRRLLPEAALSPGDPTRPAAPPSAEPIWLEPFPDDLLADPAEVPEVRYAARESITLAFMTALQALTPRQRAVLILRDVLGFRAREVASLLELTLPAVNGLLHRARAALSRRYRSDKVVPAGRAPSGISALLDRYVRAWENGDVGGLIALLKKDATVGMPPSPSWFAGRAAVRAFTAAHIFVPPNVWKLVPTRANGQPAFVLYQHAGSGPFHAFGIQVLTIQAGQIAGITTFISPDLVARFGPDRRRENTPDEAGGAVKPVARTGRRASPRTP